MARADAILCCPSCQSVLATRERNMSRSSIALGNVRAVVIIIVLAFHSVLPYLPSLPAAAYRFNSPPYQGQAFPIVDSHRWFGFDLFCAWQDVSLMALMFFLSGLFVSPSLARNGTWTFLSKRLLRIGVPCALAIVFLGRATMVLVPTIGFESSRGCATPFRSRMERASCPAGCLRR